MIRTELTCKVFNMARRIKNYLMQTLLGIMEAESGSVNMEVLALKHHLISFNYRHLLEINLSY